MQHSSKLLSGFIISLFISLITIGFLSARSLHAEEASIEVPPIDTANEPEKPNIWSVQGVIDFPFYSFYLGAPAVNGVAYLPNFSPRIGPRILWNDIGTSLTVALPLPEAEVRRRGESSQAGLIINNYWHQNAADFYYQKFSGFYVSSPFTELKVNKPTVYPQLPDAKAETYGINWYYVFDPDAYSLRAAFDPTQFQLVSGGSWLLAPFYNHLEISLGSRLIPGTDPNGLSSLPNLAAGKFDTLGCGVGYGYNHVSGLFFATLQVASGPALQLQQIERADNNDSEVGSLAIKLNINAVAGWNFQRYVGGIKGLVDLLAARIEDTQLSSSVVGVQIFVGAVY